MIRELPTGAQITDGDHVRLERQTQHYSGGDLQEVQVEVTYGTLDSSSDFQPRELADTQEVIISDTTSFKADVFSGNAPSEKGDPVSQAREAAADFIDANDLWPTST